MSAFGGKADIALTVADVSLPPPLRAIGSRQFALHILLLWLSA